MPWPHAAEDVSSLPMKTLPNPSHDFAMQMRGTLPESISSDDLANLNRALEFLFADLRRAAQSFYEAGDGGRYGAVIAVGAMARFIQLFEKPLREHLEVPSVRLQDALAGLHVNNVAPMLKPVSRPGRAVSSDSRAALMGRVAATIKRLQEAGIEREDAYRRVAKQLANMGVRSERGLGHITARTIRLWCEKVEEDVERTGTAAIIYDLNFTVEDNERFAALPREQALAFSLKSLADFVRTIFPEIPTRKKPPKPLI
jgi:hypothetical protein